MRRFVWLYVPTLYFAESLPYQIVNTVSTLIYKNMGVSNEIIGYTAYLYLPWVIKMFWGPMVDLYGTKRGWIRHMQILMAGATAVVAVGMLSPSYLTISLILFTIIAFMSATHDIATDGFYMLALTLDQQAFYVGIRSLFYRLGTIFATGALVVWAGRLEVSTGSVPQAWSTILWICAGIFVFLYLYHAWALPKPESDAPKNRTVGKSGAVYHTWPQSQPDSDRPSRPADTDSARFIDVFKTYFQQPKIIPIVLFILLYRLGEATLVKMLIPFLRDSRAAGGLAISTEAVGLAYGTGGVLSLVIGGILGGWLISKYGLKRCIWPMALALNLPDFGYLYLANAAEVSMTEVYAIVAVEQFGYGLGFTAFMVFLMYTCEGRYKTAHFAISTGLMAFGMMVPGILSGKLQTMLGYSQFFVAVLFLTIPGMLVIPFLPMRDNAAVQKT